MEADCRRGAQMVKPVSCASNLAWVFGSLSPCFSSYLILSLSMTLIFSLDIVRFCQNCVSGRTLETEHPPGHLQEAVWALGTCTVSWADAPQCGDVGNLLGLRFSSKFSNEQVSGFSVEVLIQNMAFFTPVQIFRSSIEN